MAPVPDVPAVTATGTGTAAGSTLDELWRPLAVAVAAVAAVGLLIALIAAGGAPQPEPAGLPDPGSVTGWGLPAATLVAVLAAAATVGHLLLVAALFRWRTPRLGREGQRLLVVAGVLAWVWWAAALLRLLFEVSERVAEPLPGALSGGTLVSYVTDTSAGRAAVAGLALALAVALFAATVTTVAAARVLLLAAAGALAAPAAAGHSAGSDRPWLAIASLAGHIVAVTAWAGGLAALICQARRLGSRLPEAAARFSWLALGCFVVVAGTGTVNALVHVSPADLLTSGYGALILVKTAGLVALGAVGAWHRQRTMHALTSPGPAAFLRLAGVEVAVMAALLGVAVALSTTPPPA